MRPPSRRAGRVAGRPPWPRRVGRAGFTLIEMVVAMVILTILAAIIVPALSTAVGRARIAAVRDSLEEIAAAIVAFQNDVGEYPQSLTQLVAPLVAGDADFCGDAYNGGERNNWGGPYVHRSFDPAVGIPLGVGRALDALVEVVVAGVTDLLAIVVVDVTTEEAVELDLSVDDGDGANAGSIRYIDGGAGVSILAWVIPVPDC